MKVEFVSIDNLKPNKYNPNKHETISFDLLIKSIKLFGFTQPIVVRRGTNVIIDGEHRWRVASVLNIKEVPVIYLDLDDNQMKIATIMHNRARGIEDKELIGMIRTDLKNSGWDMNKTFLEDY